VRDKWVIAPMGGDKALQRLDVIGTLVFTDRKSLDEVPTTQAQLWAVRMGGEKGGLQEVGFTCTQGTGRLAATLHQQLCRKEEWSFCVTTR